MDHIFRTRPPTSGLVFIEGENGEVRLIRQPITEVDEGLYCLEIPAEFCTENCVISVEPDE